MEDLLIFMLDALLLPLTAGGVASLDVRFHYSLAVSIFGFVWAETLAD